MKNLPLMILLLLAIGCGEGQQEVALTVVNNTDEALEIVVYEIDNIGNPVPNRTKAEEKVAPREAKVLSLKTGKYTCEHSWTNGVGHSMNGVRWLTLKEPRKLAFGRKGWVVTPQ